MEERYSKLKQRLCEHFAPKPTKFSTSLNHYAVEYSCERSHSVYTNLTLVPLHTAYTRLTHGYTHILHTFYTFYTDVYVIERDFLTRNLHTPKWGTHPTQRIKMFPSMSVILEFKTYTLPIDWHTVVYLLLGCRYGYHWTPGLCLEQRWYSFFR